MVPDYHVHTTLCGHARGTAEEYVAAAAGQGMTEICFTDHAPAPDGYDGANRMAIGQFPTYRRLVAGARKGTTINVLFGVEADYYEGGQPFLKRWLGEQDFDLVLGSVHYIGDWNFDSPVYLWAWESADVTATWREYFRLVGKLADTRLFDMLGHPDLPKKFGHRPSGKDILEMARPAWDRLAKAGMGLELNTAGLRRPAAEIFPSAALLALARERGIPICFGSDAHAPQDVGSRFDRALALAREAGYTHSVRFRRRRKELVPLP
jgi:histidinol-phosphatase (PHP family)